MHELRYVHLDDIDPAEFNPARRVREGLKPLKDSILTIGLQYPLLVCQSPNSRYRIVDGHRRHAALDAIRDANREDLIEATSNAYGYVPVIVATGDANQIYADVGDTQRRISAKEWVDCYVNGGPVPAKTRVKLEELELAGIPAQWLLDKGLSIGVLNTAKNVQKKVLSHVSLGAIVRWLGETGSTANVNAVFRSKLNMKLIRRAFEENRQVTFVLTKPTAA